MACGCVCGRYEVETAGGGSASFDVAVPSWSPLPLRLAAVLAKWWLENGSGAVGVGSVAYALEGAGGVLEVREVGSRDVLARALNFDLTDGKDDASGGGLDGVS